MLFNDFKNVLLEQKNKHGSNEDDNSSKCV
jgi:hypothetical protein